MISGTLPTLFVANMDRAVEFYHQTLGLKLVWASPDWAQLQTPDGTNIGLHPAGSKPTCPPAGQHGSIQVGFSVDRPLEQVVAELQKRGAAFRGPITDDGPVRLAFLGDPDGNDLYLCEVKKSHA